MTRNLTDAAGTQWTVREVHRHREAPRPPETDDYLIFSCPTGVRQFVPVPMLWRNLPDSTMLALLRRSTDVPGRRRSDREQSEGRH